MTLESALTEWCQSCDQRVPVAELLEVTTVRSGEVFYTHKPGVDGRCFSRTVGSVNVHRIRPAVR